MCLWGDLSLSALLAFVVDGIRFLGAAPQVPGCLLHALQAVLQLLLVCVPRASWPVLCSLGASWPFPSLGISRASFYIIRTILLLLYHKAVFPCGAGVGLILPTSGPGTVPHTWGVAMNT